MPTGYTADVMNGKVKDFKQFAMQCARAFGALITMRDDSMDAPIPDEFQPNDWNAKELAKAKQRMADLQAMTPEQLQTACQRDFEERSEQRAKYKAEQREENDRLEAMAAKVEQWTPPTGNHAEMKSFMLNQLHISRNNIGSIDKYDPIKKLTPQEWLNEQLEKAQRDIGYHAGEHEKEVERAKGRTLWVKQLRDSLAA